MVYFFARTKRIQIHRPVMVLHLEYQPDIIETNGPHETKICAAVTNIDLGVHKHTLMISAEPTNSVNISTP